MTAQELYRGLRAWFRRKYNLPPTDPRFLAMTDEEIMLEYEMEMIEQGEKLKTCPKCEIDTHRPQCPECGMTITGDQLADEIMERMEAGEDLDLTAIFKKRHEHETVGMIPGYGE